MPDPVLSIVKSEPLPTLTVADGPRGGTETYDPKTAFWNSLKQQGRQLAQGAVDTLPAVGAMVGGVLSTPETAGVGTIAGAALGAGVGRGARDLLAEWLQQEPKSTPLTKAARIALDVGTTAAAAKILPAIIEAGKTPTRTVGEMLDKTLHPLRTGDEFAQSLIKAGTKSPAITPIVTPNGVSRDPLTGQFIRIGQ